MEEATNTWRQIAEDITAAVADWLPKLVGALVVLIVGWLAAVLARAVAGSLLRRLGVDRLAERSGLADSLETAGLNRSASALISGVIYWLVLLLFVMIALEGLGLTAVTDALASLINYLPRIAVAALVILIGSLFARVIGDAVGAVSVQYGISGGAALGRLVQYGILAVTVIVALQQMLIDTTLLTSILVVVLGALSVTLALAFGLGTRHLAEQVVAGLYARDTFKAGQRIRVGEVEGRLISIGRASTLVQTETGKVSIPNDLLLSTEVVIVNEAAGDAQGGDAQGNAGA